MLQFASREIVKDSLITHKYLHKKERTMITVLGYVLAIIWIVIKVCAIICLGVILFDKDLYTSISDNPPWQILTRLKEIREGTSCFNSRTHYLLLEIFRVFLLSSMIFLLVPTVINLFEDGIHPMDPELVITVCCCIGTAMIICLSCYLYSFATYAIKR
jgi:hypothetical protein